MSELFKDKYLKYKTKYLQLKSQIGSGDGDEYLDIFPEDVDKRGPLRVSESKISVDSVDIGDIPVGKDEININKIKDKDEVIRLYNKNIQELSSFEMETKENQNILILPFLSEEQQRSIIRMSSVIRQPIGTTGISAQPIGTTGISTNLVDIRNNIITYMPDTDTKLIDCYIASSHNTYFSGDQMLGSVDINCYINFLIYFKGGCVEFDPLVVVKNKDGVLDVKVGHYRTPTHTLSLRSIFLAIKTLLDNPKSVIIHPIIFSFDNKSIKKFEEHQLIWSMINTYLGKYLYTNFNDDELKLKNINKKILIKWKQCPKQECLQSSYNEKCRCTGLIQPNNEIFKTIDKPDVTKYWTNMNSNNTKSLSDNHDYTHDLNKIRKFINKNIKENELSKDDFLYKSIPIKNYKIYKILQKFIRKYPPGRNIKSGNYPFITEILYGVNMVALNLQSEDIHTMFMLEFFRETSIRKKPSWFYNETLKEIPIVTYKIFFNKEFTNINICDENENIKKCNSINTSHNQFALVEVTSEIEIIYLRLNYKGGKWHGGITLNRNNNILYKYKKNNLNCNWLLELDNKLVLNIKYLQDINSTVFIEITPNGFIDNI